MNTSRAWAVAGLAAGIAGIVGIAASMSISAVYDEELGGNAQGIYVRMQDFVPNIVVFHTATLVGVVLLVVFGAGLRRRLQAQLPGGQPPARRGLRRLAADVRGRAHGQLARHRVRLGARPNRASQGRARGLRLLRTLDRHVPWLWVGAGLTGVALAVAALRHRAVPRWIGWVGAVLGGLTLAFGVSPLQYMAGMFGPLFVTIAAAGFLFGDRNEAIAPVGE